MSEVPRMWLILSSGAPDDGVLEPALAAAAAAAAATAPVPVLPVPGSVLILPRAALESRAVASPTTRIACGSMACLIPDPPHSIQQNMSLVAVMHTARTGASLSKKRIRSGWNTGKPVGAPAAEETESFSSAPSASPDMLCQATEGSEERQQGACSWVTAQHQTQRHQQLQQQPLLLAQPGTTEPICEHTSMPTSVPAIQTAQIHQDTAEPEAATDAEFHHQLEQIAFGPTAQVPIVGTLAVPATLPGHHKGNDREHKVGLELNSQSNSGCLHFICELRLANHYQLLLDIMSAEEDKNEGSLIVAGRDLSRIPCFRKTFLTSISSGIGAGLLYFLFTSRVQMATHRKESQDSSQAPLRSPIPDLVLSTSTQREELPTAGSETLLERGRPSQAGPTARWGPGRPARGPLRPGGPDKQAFRVPVLSTPTGELLGMI
ncbi:uncharacterized protein GBIM_06327 [Gryllus bimaculatus]|nr:uncharacterized protein GBIM_06327 [Gryllus bimaculatus]